MESKPCNLITQSIIDAVNFYDTMGNYPIKDTKVGFEKEAARGITWKEYAYEQLMAKVNRTKTPFPERARWGVNFENAVYAAVQRTDVQGSEEFKQIVEAIRGYTLHNKCGINIEIPGVEDICYVYTKEDALNLPRITDLKTTENYKEGKYLKGIQHELYCYRWIKAGQEVKDFKYLIAEWDKYPKVNKVYEEKFIVSDPDKLILDVERKIKDFIERLKELSLFDAYQENFCLYPWNGKEVYKCEKVKGEDFGF